MYDEVTGAGGVSSVVTSPIGPTPPSGPQSYCEDAPPPEPGEDPYCETTYYHIKTNADWMGTDPATGDPRQATVCVRFTATTNAPLDWMRLYHRITAVGASGGRPTATPALTGGCGAELSGVFRLQAGDVVEVVVGQQGGSGAKSAGGGGGTFVAKNQASGPPIPLIIAGGGGGVRYGGTVPGRDASLTTAGGAGSTSATYTSGFIPGGVDGLGGARQSTYGSGGGGWSGNGANDGTYGEAASRSSPPAPPARAAERARPASAPTPSTSPRAATAAHPAATRVGAR